MAPFERQLASHIGAFYMQFYDQLRQGLLRFQHRVVSNLFAPFEMPQTLYAI
jgi:hypothetical protein